MKKEIINGASVPYDKSTEELEKMLSTGSMSDFVVACEALSYKTDEKSFELLENYTIDKDKNKRFCIFSRLRSRAWDKCSRSAAKSEQKPNCKGKTKK